MAAGNGFTVTVANTVQPVPIVNVMSEVPAAMPLTLPVAISIVATELFPLVHTPVPDGSVKEVVRPAHTDRVPEIAAGSELTVTTAEVTQPGPRIKDMVEVPALLPVTMPVGPMGATPGSLVVQIPEPLASLSVDVLLTHTKVFPEIGASTFSVTTFVTRQPVVSI